jgi:hypothetical protein
VPEVATKRLRRPDSVFLGPSARSNILFMSIRFDSIRPVTWRPLSLSRLVGWDMPRCHGMPWFHPQPRRDKPVGVGIGPDKNSKLVGYKYSSGLGIQAR